MIGRFNVSNLISKKGETPIVLIFLDRRDYFLVNLISFLKGLIERKFSDLTTHGCLRKIDDSLLIILHIITSFDWVYNLDVNDTVDLNWDIIFSYTCLGRNLNDLLTQIMDVIDLVNERNLEVEAWFELRGELFESVKHDSVFLTNYNGKA